DYAGASLDRKSTTKGYHFLGSRLISWQCKKQTIVANSTTEEEYVATSNCYGQVIGFLNVNPIKYALMVNPTIYTSCIEQFWATATAKNINGEAQIHAKVDGKKVIISEATIRRDLKFEDEGGVNCLSNEVIFEQPPLMSNMKRVGKLFSRRDTPLFPTMIVQPQEELGKDTKIPTDTQHTPTIIQPTTFQPQRKQKPRKTRRKDIKLSQTSVPTEVVVDEAVFKKMHDSVERAATTATSLDAEKDRGIISKTQFTATLNKPSFTRTSLGSGPRRQETMGDAVAQTRLERKMKSRSHGLKRLYKVGLSARVESSTEEEIIEDITTADIKETVSIVAPITTIITDDELTMAQALVKIKKSKHKSATTTTTTVTIPTPDSIRPKARGVIMQEPSETSTMTTIPKSLKVQDKGKGIMVEEPLKMKNKDQISFDDQEKDYKLRLMNKIGL
nr:ribonuclease H-like domain, reverse transcriptase, RNA-dependent DNA polymerase [Tanacetum cinerariifolium]